MSKTKQRPVRGAPYYQGPFLSDQESDAWSANYDGDEMVSTHTCINNQKGQTVALVVWEGWSDSFGVGTGRLLAASATSYAKAFGDFAIEAADDDVLADLIDLNHDLVAVLVDILKCERNRAKELKPGAPAYQFAQDRIKRAEAAVDAARSMKYAST